MSSWFVYIIQCNNGSLYTGCTNHIIRRWHQHANGTGARFLRANPPKALVFMEVASNRSEACKREYQIKQFSRKAKLELIAKHNTL